MNKCECCKSPGVARIDVMTVHGQTSVIACSEHVGDTMTAATLLGAAPRLELLPDLPIPTILDLITRLGAALGPDTNVQQLKVVMKLWEPKLSI